MLTQEEIMKATQMGFGKSHNYPCSTAVSIKR